ncbi:hypothetical protein AURANDRAFT_15540, partial [Aureococcus anophagefferens]
FLPELSPNLAKEVRLFWCRDMILNVPFFRLFPSQVVQRLVCAVRVEFYMPDDYIILVGEFGHEMFFIKSGTVDVFRIDEAEQIVCSLREGEYFGDVALLTKSQRTATIKARTFVTCAIISRDQFEGLLADHP